MPWSYDQNYLLQILFIFLFYLEYFSLYYYDPFTTLHIIYDHSSKRSLQISPCMETDDCSTSDHNNTLLRDIRSIHWITNRSSSRILLYGVHCSRTRYDVDHYEFIFSCSIIILYGKIPENYRRDTRLSNTVLGDYIRIYHRGSDPWHDNWYDCTHGGYVFYSCIICSYWTHDIICISHFTSLRPDRAFELTHCR